MFDIDFTVNLLTLFIIIASAGAAGYAFRSREIRQKRMKLVKLRRELLDNHANILALQKECVALENMLCSSKIAILPLKSIVKDFDAEEVNHSSISKPDWDNRLNRKAN